jgi:L-lactate dehydrogenase complex protein LldG
MSSKDSILSAIRRNRPPTVDLPAVAADWITYPDRQQQFIDLLEAVGGQAFVGTRGEFDKHLRTLPIYTNAQHIVSLVPGIGASDVDLSTIDSPHALDNIDIAILSGEFAVAENASIWVTDGHLPFRVLYFLCQHLVLVVHSHDILNNLHEAYDRLEQSKPFANAAFGTFISGPSKTADIEQSLVIGAHGPRSLTVCVLSEETTEMP